MFYTNEWVFTILIECIYNLKITGINKILTSDTSLVKVFSLWYSSSFHCIHSDGKL